ncbi:MAG: CotH kinase family protein [Myxococcota bacterium]
MLPLLACTSTTIPSDPASPRDSVATEAIGDAPRDTAPPAAAHLPVVLVETEGAIGDGVKVDGTIEVIEDHDGTLADLDAAERAYAGPIGIEIHGSSSTGYPKLGYKLECRDADGTDGNCALAGMPEGSDWVLHAPYSDKTFMRNALAYSLARDVAGDRWEPRAQLVELFLGGEYAGVYLLVERVSVEDDRLVIPPTVDDAGVANGGFVVKVDQHRSEGFDTSYGTPIDWAEPKLSEVTPDAARYILGWFDGFEAALLADGWEQAWPAWIDADAWVDHWLLNELAHNIDAYRLSAYLWTDGPPPATLRAGPAWDFDRAWGNVNYCESWTTDGWIWDSLDRCGYAYQYPFWWERLREDPAFRDRLRARWDELRAGPLADEAIVARISELRAAALEAQPRDDARWGTIGEYVDPNWYVGETWDEEIRWLRDWALERAAWMDEHVGEP